MADLLRYTIVLFSALIVGASIAVIRHAPQLVRYVKTWRTLLLGVALLVAYVGAIHWRELINGDSIWEDVLVVSGLSTILASLLVLAIEHRSKDD